LAFGANLDADFEVVGTLQTAVGDGGYEEVRSQLLLKPVRSVENAVQVCAAIKKRQQSNVSFDSLNASTYLK